MSDLAAFQDQFSEALHHSGDLTGNGDAKTLRIGLSVHRNTVYKALIDALRANYPTVERLAGDEWFKASAYAFLAENHPEEASLSAFGVTYPDFLATLPAAAELPYLPGVARLDRFWTEAHIAADADVLSPAALAGIPSNSLFDLKFRLHPSARLRWFAQPSPSIWRLNRPPSPVPAPDRTRCRLGRRRRPGRQTARRGGHADARRCEFRLPRKMPCRRNSRPSRDQGSRDQFRS